MTDAGQNIAPPGRRRSVGAWGVLIGVWLVGLCVWAVYLAGIAVLVFRLL